VRRAGIEPIVLHPGDELLALARAAVDDGADAIGVAGGDGTQALIAELAWQRDLPYVCVPAGTRNHFAFDVGVDRDDVVGALDAFVHGSERRIDLARVNGRIFVNNSSLGVYAEIVQSTEYRDAKVETVARMLPDLLPPRAGSSDLRFTAPDGARWEGAHLLLVSNNPYRLPRPGVRGTRGGVNAGLLGIIAGRLATPNEVGALMRTESTGEAPRVPGWLNFVSPTFAIDASSPVPVALDGEPFVLDPPLRFESLPSALRVLVRSHDR